VGVLPKSLTHLSFGYLFDQSIAGIIPATVIEMKLGHSRLGVGDLPNSLKILRLRGFAHPLMDGVLPSSLEELDMSLEFNHPLKPGVLPQSLTCLRLGDYFNQPIPPGVLPDSLTSLKFGHKFNHPLIPGVLPHSLKFLHIGHCFNHPILPDVLPPLLEELSFGRCCTYTGQNKSRFNHPFLLGTFPNSLLKLSLGNEYNQPILPGLLSSTRLHTLQFGHAFNQSVEGCLFPPTLRHLEFGKAFRFPVTREMLASDLEIFRVDQLAYSIDEWAVKGELLRKSSSGA
jgi:hypothetical protein